MTSKRTKRLLLCLALLLAGLGIAHLPTFEPRYEERPFTEWLSPFFADEMIPLDHAEEVMRSVGTRGIPTLLHLMRAKDGAWKGDFAEWAAKYGWRIHYKTAKEKNALAASGFRGLGKEGKEAVPELMRIYQHPISITSQKAAAASLGSIGPDAKAAVPMLLSGMLTNSAPDVQDTCLDALVGIHSRPELVVPVLTNLLTNVTLSVQFKALSALENYGPDAKAAVPVLLSNLRFTENYFQNHQDPYHPKRREWELGRYLRVLKAIDYETATNEAARLDVPLSMLRIFATTNDVTRK